MIISETVLRKEWPRASAEMVHAVSAQFDAVAARFNLTKLNRIVDFMAQISHESDGGTIKTENMSYTAKRLPEVWPTRFRDAATCRKYAKNPEALGEYVYGGRMGNDQPGDGYRYRGRGLLQITGKEAYAKYGALIGVDLIGNPDLASQPEHALAIAAAEFSNPAILRASDEGNFTRVTKLVNGGTTGLASRQDWRRKWASVLSEPAPVAAARPADAILMHGDAGYQVSALQDRLRVLGFFRGVSDGKYGDLTEGAIRRFQKANGLPETGIVDADTQADLQNDDTSSVPVSEARATATVAEAEDAGSTSVSTGTALKTTGAVGLLGAGSLDTISSYADKVSEYSDKAGALKTATSPVVAFLASHQTALIFGATAVMVIVVGYILQRKGLLRFRAGG